MNPLAVYVHIPFCTVKCGYCDFNAYAGLDGLKRSYRDALLAEIAGRSTDLSRHTVTSIAFGGGTPGEQPAEDLIAVIDAIRDCTGIAPDAEISIEVNPGTTVEPYLRALQSAGVNRVSIGAQSFDAQELQFLDRIHSVQAIGATVLSARRANIESVNIDLIFGLPGQTPRQWEANLEHALGLGVDHVSAYALTLEEGTRLGHRVSAGEVEMPSEDILADLYGIATARLEQAGFHQYEISNWAATGHQSRHNRTYWEYGEYLGLGAGAHGFFEEERYENIAHPRQYITAALAGPPGVIAEAYHPDRATAVIDFLALRLRLLEGFPLAEFKRRFGLDIDTVFGEPLGRALDAGLLDYQDHRLALSQSGRLLHGEVVAQCLAHLRSHPGVLDGAAAAAR